MGVIDRLAALADPARDRIERRRSHRARRPRRGCRALGRRGRFTHALQFRGVIGRRARGRLGGHRLGLHRLRDLRYRLGLHRLGLGLRRHWLRLHLRRPGCFLQLGDAPGLGAQRGGLVFEVPPGQFLELRAQPGELGLDLAQHLDIDSGRRLAAAHPLEHRAVRLAARLRGVELGLEAFGTGHQFALRLIAVAAQPGY